MEFSIYILIGYTLALLAYFYSNIVTQGAIIVFWSIAFANTLFHLTFFKSTLINWSSDLSFQLNFSFDGLSSIFALLVSGISIAIFIYAYLYFLSDQGKRARLNGLLQAFGVSMLGCVTSDNMIALFLFWEMTTVTSYLLIQFNYADDQSNQLAFNAMLISVIGGFCLLAAFLWMSLETGSMSLSYILSLTNNADINVVPIFILVLLGAITKSAQFPFHFWLPGAMKAPTPVSAYLHSATMVNLGLYILARFHSLFHYDSYWYFTLTTIGLITMLISAVISMMKTDLKEILAYTTIFSLGLMVYLLGSSKWLAIQAMLVFLIFHGIYKSGLFMLTGVIDKEYGTRNVKELIGIARHRWLIGINALVLFSSMAGLPPFFGFAMKEMLYEAKLSPGSIFSVTMIAGVIASAILSAASIRCLFYLFHKNDQENRVIKSNNMIWLPTIMTILIMSMWLFEPYLSIQISNAVDVILNTKIVYQYSISWKSTLLSTGTFAFGVFLFMLYVYFRNKLHLAKFFELDGNEVLKNLVYSFVGIWKNATEYLQNISIDKKYKIIIFAVVISISAFKGSLIHNIPNFYLFNQIPIVLIATLVMIITSYVVIRSHDVLVDVVSLALFGLFLCAVYLYLGAPDVSMTQFLIEILSIVIIALVFGSEIITVKCQCSKNTFMRTFLSLGFGLFVFLVMVSFWKYLQPQQVLDYYHNNSLKTAFGRNIVNVILVDFRSLDTLGEVLVVLGAMVGVLSYMRRASSED